jgi:hypothetical protein
MSSGLMMPIVEVATIRTMTQTHLEPVGAEQRHDPPGAATGGTATAGVGSRLCHHEATPSGSCEGTYQ